MDQYIQIIITIIGSGAIFSFLQFLITRRDTKKEKGIDNKLDHLKDEVEENIDSKVRMGAISYKKQMDIINKITESHRQSTEQLQNSIDQLTQNDIAMKKIIDKMSDQQDIIAETLIGQTHDRVLFLAKKISDRKCVTVKEKAIIEAIYKPYVKLGGNGEVKKSVEYIEKLPIVDEDEAREMDRKLETKHFESIYNQIEKK